MLLLAHYILPQIINSYYSNLVNIVYSFGGDIIKIAGDALYCVFLPDEHDIRGAVLCAALCSMQLKDVSGSMSQNISIDSTVAPTFRQNIKGTMRQRRSSGVNIHSELDIVSIALD